MIFELKIDPINQRKATVNFDIRLLPLHSLSRARFLVCACAVDQSRARASALRQHQQTVESDFILIPSYLCTCVCSSISSSHHQNCGLDAPLIISEISLFQREPDIFLSLPIAPSPVLPPNASQPECFHTGQSDSRTCLQKWRPLFEEQSLGSQTPVRISFLVWIQPAGRGGCFKLAATTTGNSAGLC